MNQDPLLPHKKGMCALHFEVVYRHNLFFARNRDYSAISAGCLAYVRAALKCTDW